MRAAAQNWLRARTRCAQSWLQLGGLSTQSRHQSPIKPDIFPYREADVADSAEPAVLAGGSQLWCVFVATWARKAEGGSMVLKLTEQLEISA